MKYVIYWTLLLSIVLFASDQNALRSLNRPNSFLYKMADVIEKYHIDENNSQEIASQIKRKMFEWYASHCDHNDSATIEDLIVQWNAIEQSCPQMDKNNQRMIINLILRDYDAAIMDMTPYKSKQLSGETGLILNRRNGEIVVIGTKEQSSARKLKIPYGTIIKSVNGKSIDNMCIEDVWNVLRGEVSSQVTIATDKNISYPLTVELPLTPTVFQTSMNDNIAIIKIRSFDNDAPKNITKILQQLPPNMNIVLDLRNNAGGLLPSVYDVLNQFIPAHTQLFTQKARYKYDDINYVSEKQIKYFPNSIIVLINHGTSAGALLAAKVLQKENATIVGYSQETISSIKVIMPLNEIDALKLPIAKFYLPDGTIASGTTVTSDIPLDTDSLDDDALYKIITKIINDR